MEHGNYKWKGKRATMTPEFFRDTEINPYQPFEWKNELYRPIGWNDNGDLYCRVLELIQ